MIEEARKIAGSSEVWPLPAIATYEDFDSPSATQRYTGSEQELLEIVR